MWKADCHQVPLCVESDDSKKKEADIQEDRADSLFIKSPASAKAEERIFMAILTTGRSVSVAALGERLLSGN